MSMKETMTKNEKKKLLLDEFADTDNLNDSDNYSNYQNTCTKKLPALPCEERAFVTLLFCSFSARNW